MVTRAEAKQQTREQLLLAGMELFREQGLDAPSLDAICERAGKTRGAFYVHFADREAFQVAVMERILMAYVATIVTTADPAGDLLRTIEAFTDGVIALAEGRSDPSPIGILGSDQLRLLLQGVHRNQAVKAHFVSLVHFSTDRLAEVIAAAQAGGQVRTDIEARAMALVLVGQVFGLMAMLETGVPSVDDVQAVKSAILSLLKPPSA